MKKAVLGVALLLAGGLAAAPLVEERQIPDVHAFTNARIVIAPGRVIEKGTLVIRGGLIAAAGADVVVPPDARIRDMTGCTLAPAFVEPHAAWTSAFGKESRGASRPDDHSPFGCEGCLGDHDWTARGGKPPKAPEGPAPEPVRASFQVSRALPERFGKFEDLWKGGIGAALLSPEEGVLRGTGCLALLAPGESARRILKERASQHFSFEHYEGTYPSAMMGSVALLRQSFLDRDWARASAEIYARRPVGLSPPRTDGEISALVAAQRESLPAEFDGPAWHDALRAAGLAREAGLSCRVLTGWDGWRHAADLAALGVPLLLRLDFPDTPEVADDDRWEEVTLEQLRAWHHAPGTPARLAEVPVRFAFTTHGLAEPSQVFERVRTAVARGLPADAALAALTTVPAGILGVDASLGTLEAGKIANILVFEKADAGIFGKDVVLAEIWVDGERHLLEEKLPETAGTWSVRLRESERPEAERTVSVEVKGKPGYLTIPGEGTRVSFAAGVLLAEFPVKETGLEGRLLLEGRVAEDRWTGRALLDGKAAFAFEASRAKKEKKDKEEKEEKSEKGDIPEKPPIPVTRDRGPLSSAKDILFRGATLWTSAKAGVLAGHDLLVRDGKIAAIGKDLAAPKGALVVEAKGRHLTPGLIDAHSHTAIVGGVNEYIPASSAEVRIEDVIDAETQTIYQQLAGGVTAVHLMHGSANAIGGQSGFIKFRWGEPPDALKLSAAVPGIKFALGENPKRVGKQHDRYPQTRPGIEQFIRERFLAAGAYLKERQEYDALPKGRKAERYPPRRDLSLDPLAEILQGKRRIHCHCYRQDEILMLIRVAEEMGFKVGTFHHVLEGYKVAEAIARHGAGAATFSDWWAFKVEAFDAIPENGALLARAGVCVSFKSDSSRLARLMNREAAKAVRCGGVSEEEALAFVTTNPARQLGVESRVGSLEPGKDADLALWSASPLDGLTVCDQTWVDGVLYFDRERDRAMRAELAAEREKLVARARESRDPDDKDGKKGKGRRGK